MRLLKICCLIFGLFIFYQCTDEKADNTALIITVLTDHPQFKPSNRVPAALIKTKSLPAALKTRSDGMILIENLPLGEHEFEIEHHLLSTKNKIIRIDQTGLIRDTVFLYQKDTELNPAFDVTIYGADKPFNTGEQISVSVQMNHWREYPLKLGISSSIDGVVYDKVYEDPFKVFSPKIVLTSGGSHEVTVSVTDAAGFTSSVKRNIEVLNPLKLQLDKAERIVIGEVQLTWSYEPKSHFDKIEIYRTLESTDLIATISDPMQNTFTDKNIPLIANVTYSLALSDKNGRRVVSQPADVENPSGKVYSLEVFSLKIHPDKPVLVGQSVNDYTLASINWEKEQIIRKAAFSGFVKSTCVFENTSGISIMVNTGDNQISWFDMETLAERKRINLNLLKYHIPESVAELDNDKFIVGVSSGMGEYYRVYDYNTGKQTGENIPGPIGYLIKDKTRNRIVGECSFFNNYNFISMEFSQDGVLTNTSKVSGKNNWGKFDLAPNGEFLVSKVDGEVYRTNKTFDYCGSLMSFVSDYSRVKDFVISEDSKYIILSCEEQRGIHIFSYPELFRVAHIQTKGYPTCLFVQNGKIISQSLTDWNSDLFWGIEEFNINQYLKK